MIYSYDLSIVIPAFNAGDSLQKWLESIAYQDNHIELQVIIVDDGSFDDTSKISEEFAFPQNFTKETIQQKNSGEALARNAGLKKVTGRYVLFLDSNDCLVPGILRKLVDYADENSSDLVYANYYKELRNDRFKSIINPKQNLDKKGLIKKFFRRQVIVGIGNTIVRTELIISNNITFQPYKAGADNHFFREIVQYTERSGHVDAFAFVYRFNANSVMHKKYSARRMDSIYSVLDTKVNIKDEENIKYLDVFLLNEIRANYLAYKNAQSYNDVELSDIDENDILAHLPSSIKYRVFFCSRRPIWIFSLLLFYFEPKMFVYLYGKAKKCTVKLIECHITLNIMKLV